MMSRKPDKPSSRISCSRVATKRLACIRPIIIINTGTGRRRRRRRFIFGPDDARDIITWARGRLTSGIIRCLSAGTHHLNIIYIILYAACIGITVVEKKKRKKKVRKKTEEGEKKKKTTKNYNIPHRFKTGFPWSVGIINGNFTTFPGRLV